MSGLLLNEMDMSGNYIRLGGYLILSFSSILLYPEGEENGHFVSILILGKLKYKNDRLL